MEYWDIMKYGILCTPSAEACGGADRIRWHPACSIDASRDPLEISTHSKIPTKSTCIYFHSYMISDGTEVHFSLLLIIVKGY
jgi:hypothetical protein